VVEKRNKADEDGDEDRPLDLLDHILESDSMQELTSEDLVKNIYLFFLAGQETSAGTLVSTFYFLAKHQDVQQKAYEEVMDVLGAKGPLNLENIGKLIYLEAILKEALRVHTPVYRFTTRLTLKDMIIDGYHVPAGTNVAVNLLPTHMSKRFWGDDALEFKPERFLGSGGAKSSKQLFAFSHGPHVCIGKKFAMWEMKTILAMVLQRYHVVSTTPGWVWKDMSLRITTEPASPLEVILERRT